MSKVSIVMTSYNRPAQLEKTLTSIRAQNYPSLEIVLVDDGKDQMTPRLCKDFGVRYIKLNRARHPKGYVLTPARPLNIGIKAATGDILILQNAECKHADKDTIERLVSKLEPDNVVFARVIAIHSDEKEKMVYCGDPERMVPYFFCGAIHKSHVTDLGGFDEEFSHSGFDDDDFGDRLKRSGLKFVFSDVKVFHQWHPSGGKIFIGPMRELFQKKQSEDIVRNKGREWGKL
jgi:GT2 family glycosyltransferase